MKKTILSISLVGFAATSAMFITSCSKDDTPPVVSILGDATETVTLGDSYLDLGATATDDKDGTLLPTTSGSVDENTEDTYTLTYTASDKEGNQGTASREVNVVIVRQTYVNNYHVTGSLTVGTSTNTETPYYTDIQTSSVSSDRVNITNFAGSGATVYGSVSGSLSNGAQSVHTLTIPAQQFTDPNLGTVNLSSGSGTLNNKGQILTLTWSGNASSIAFSGNETYTKQ